MNSKIKKYLLGIFAAALLVASIVFIGEKSNYGKNEKYQKNIENKNQELIGVWIWQSMYDTEILKFEFFDDNTFKFSGWNHPANENDMTSRGRWKIDEDDNVTFTFLNKNGDWNKLIQGYAEEMKNRFGIIGFSKEDNSMIMESLITSKYSSSGKSFSFFGNNFFKKNLDIFNENTHNRKREYLYENIIYKENGITHVKTLNSDIQKKDEFNIVWGFEALLNPYIILKYDSLSGYNRGYLIIDPNSGKEISYINKDDLEGISPDIRWIVKSDCNEMDGPMAISIETFPDRTKIFRSPWKMYRCYGGLKWKSDTNFVVKNNWSYHTIKLQDRELVVDWSSNIDFRFLDETWKYDENDFIITRVHEKINGQNTDLIGPEISEIKDQILLELKKSLIISK